MPLKSAFFKAIKSLAKTGPAILSVILLIGLIMALVPKDFYAKIFINNTYIDSVLGAAIGSIAVGNPVTSYILGGEMLKQGISIIAVTAFIVAWVTVGVIQFPAEATILGKKFAFIRNITAAIFAIIIAIFTGLIMAI
jgi:uncharacterized membrane protein YraQ (UPF0718 family)